MSSSTKNKRGTAVCGRPGLWTFAISRIMPWGECRPIGAPDRETVAADLICEHFPTIADRDASLLVEQAAETGSVIRGDLSIVLAKVA